MSRSLNRVEISRKALRHNFRVCREKAGQSAIMPMVKADAYGHGMLECAGVFAEEGAAAFGVAEASEGALLREAGFNHPVYVLVGVLPETVGDILKYALTPVIADSDVLPELSRQAVERNIDVGLHLKVDAGMGRQGILPEDVSAVVHRIKGLPGLYLAGLMAHFPMADDRASANTLEVFERFKGVTRVIEHGPGEILFHIANSGGLFHFAGTRMNMVRPGISLYGCHAEGEPQQVPGKIGLLEPVMKFTTRVIQVRTVPAGTGLGYGHTYFTGRRTRLAVLSVGYEDGYLRCLSNKAEVLIHGRRVPVVGRVSMNLTLADITDIGDEVRQGDEAVLLGRQGSEIISADELASWMDTISYEVLCLFGNLNCRYYID
ncbi:MAG: alanine racemase [Desulfobulbaceae bacterium]|nr:alanine racemase [Desulfobulbaceae bacterium]